MIMYIKKLDIKYFTNFTIKNNQNNYINKNNCLLKHLITHTPTHPTPTPYKDTPIHTFH